MVERESEREAWWWCHRMTILPTLTSSCGKGRLSSFPPGKPFRMDFLKEKRPKLLGYRSALTKVVECQCNGPCTTHLLLDDISHRNLIHAFHTEDLFIFSLQSYWVFLCALLLLPPSPRWKISSNFSPFPSPPISTILHFSFMALHS